MSTDILASLEALARVMSDAQDEWFLIGGAAFLLHGLEQVTLDDIDVVLSVADIERLAERRGIKAKSVRGTALFRSELLLIWDALPVKIEFMAGLEVCYKKQWVRVEPESYLKVPVGNSELCIPTYDDFERICKMFGRPKDLQRLKELGALKGSD